MKIALLLLSVPLIAAVVAGSITFEDITTKSGVRFVTHSPTDNIYYPETMVSGIAIFDYDGDGFPDLYFVNGGSMPSLKRTGPEMDNRLYRNNGDLTFTDVTARAGVAGSGYGMAVAVGDYDNDGHPDLFVANLTENQLFRNNGDGTFTDVTAKAHLSGALFHDTKMWAAAAAWLDYNNDGLLDLVVSNYAEWKPGSDPNCDMNGHRVYCSPKYYKPLPCTLYRNNGDGTFSDVSKETGIFDHPGRGMGIAILDYDNDGYPDIYVANDTAPNQLFHNINGKRFEEIAEDQMLAFVEDGKLISSMGAAAGDVLNNGRTAIWVTALNQQTFPLFVNTGNGFFEDQTSKAGLSGTRSMAGWSNAIIDLDNDRWKDLVAARSHVMPNIELFANRKYEEPISIFRNRTNGKFEDVSQSAGPALQVSAVHRGMAYGDLDNDGKLDLVATVLNGRARVLHNTTLNRNHWLTLELIGTKSNRMGIGARVRLTETDGSTQYNYATTSTGYASSSDPRVHFGLGQADRVKSVEIEWPSGIRQVLSNVPVDRVLPVKESQQ